VGTLGCAAAAAGTGKNINILFGAVLRARCDRRVELRCQQLRAVLSLCTLENIRCFLSQVGLNVRIGKTWCMDELLLLGVTKFGIAAVNACKRV
jgi:hypothetical protein